jgi:hypothetical protein
MPWYVYVPVVNAVAACDMYRGEGLLIPNLWMILREMKGATF